MDYNPFAPAVKENPYPYYAYLRRHAPAHRVEPFGFWTISRYADVDYVVRNPQLFSSAALFDVMLGDRNPVPEAPSLISSDPPGAHTPAQTGEPGFHATVDCRPRTTHPRNYVPAHRASNRERV